ncbi:MAG TPA: RimK/LysX family protein [Rudaea sp.]|nr:RimK/LysX family protein [Rudaea sp.]
MSKVHDPASARIAGTSRVRLRDTKIRSATVALRAVGKKKVLGWKEFVSLPDLGNIRLLAKLDTGARTSALHAGNLTFNRRHGKLWVEFDLPDFHTSVPQRFKLPVVEHRKIRSSIGSSQLRPVVLLALNLAEQLWTTEVTLTDRSDMELPMLIGRSALKRRFVVDPARTRLASPRHVSPHATTIARDHGGVPTGENR